MPSAPDPSRLGAAEAEACHAAGADGHLLSVAAWCERILGFGEVPVL
jgi:hypothetical protein